MSDVETMTEKTNTKSEYELLNELMDDYGQAVQQLVFTYVHDYAIAEDLTQEIFLKVYKKLHTFKGDSSLKTWLYRIAINHCKDYVRSWHHRHFVVDDQLARQAQARGKQVDQEVIEKTEEERLVQAVLALSIKYREAVYLYYYEDLSTKEISVLTEENENTIKTRLNRARKMIKKELDKEDVL